MSLIPDKILSASRRTDIPAFYMDWFMDQINLGFFNIKNPYNKSTRKIDASRESVHSIVFWSKKYHRTICFLEPSMKKQRTIVNKMVKHLNSAGINLYLCCEKELFSTLGADTKIQQNSCIDGNLLKQIYNGNTENKKDYGQRAKLGCKCTKSIDIGSYDLHPCFHNCLFCYANPDIDNIKTNNI